MGATCDCGSNEDAPTDVTGRGKATDKVLDTQPLLDAETEYAETGSEKAASSGSEHEVDDEELPDDDDTMSVVAEEEGDNRRAALGRRATRQDLIGGGKKHVAYASSVPLEDDMTTDDEADDDAAADHLSAERRQMADLFELVRDKYLEAVRLGDALLWTLPKPVIQIDLSSKKCRLKILLESAKLKTAKKAIKDVYVKADYTHEGGRVQSQKTVGDARSMAEDLTVLDLGQEEFAFEILKGDNGAIDIDKIHEGVWAKMEDANEVAKALDKDEHRAFGKVALRVKKKGSLKKGNLGFAELRVLYSILLGDLPYSGHPADLELPMFLTADKSKKKKKKTVTRVSAGFLRCQCRLAGPFLSTPLLQKASAAQFKVEFHILGVAFNTHGTDEEKTAPSLAKGTIRESVGEIDVESTRLKYEVKYRVRELSGNYVVKTRKCEEDSYKLKLPVADTTTTSTGLLGTVAEEGAAEDEVVDEAKVDEAKVEDLKDAKQAFAFIGKSETFAVPRVSLKHGNSHMIYSAANSTMGQPLDLFKAEGTHKGVALFKESPGMVLFQVNSEENEALNACTLVSVFRVVAEAKLKGAEDANESQDLIFVEPLFAAIEDPNEANKQIGALLLQAKVIFN